ncbi:MAG: protein kinase [Vicinamibacterales bacterium]
MALTPGTRLGVYEILAQIGAGGMGEVYRATDTTLGRQVAIKILPDAFAADTERVARFEREAKTLASLNHPNIAGIYGFEKSGGTHALVMELVQGDDLSQRIARGAIPVDEALPIAKQIAEALEAAHEQGIIHRDLKPANIKVRPDGTVKVLDFGLAKAMELVGAASPSVSQAPTITTPAMMTGVGMILGTAAYMSPEQTRGGLVDRRTDVWAFGCVLYEMLTGHRAFAGDTVSDTVAAVLRSEPDWHRIPVTAPRAVVALVRQCVDKDATRRVRGLGTALFVLEHQTAADSGRPVGSLRPSLARVVWAFAFAVMALVAAAVAWQWLRPAITGPVSRLTVDSADPATTLSVDGVGRDVAISPDGMRLVYSADNSTALAIRSIDRLEPLMIRDIGLVRQPFISPDSQWVGFFDGNTIMRKMGMNGGSPVTITTVDGAGVRGATWGDDGSIVFATNSVATGLMRVSADGGTSTVLTMPAPDRDERDHQWPEFLPGSKSVIFTVLPARGGISSANVALFDVTTSTWKVLLRGASHAHYLSSGHLVFAAAGALRAVPFDLATLEVRGAPVEVVGQVLTTPFGAADFDVSAGGSLLYVTGTTEALNARQLVWVDREGRETSTPLPARTYAYPRLSPDESRIAVTTNDQDLDIWMWDVARRTLSRTTFDPGQDSYPVWAPDGRSIFFQSARLDGFGIFRSPVDNSGVAEAVESASTKNARQPTSISPDGQWLVFTDNTATPDIMMLRLSGDRNVVPLVQSPSVERNGMVSPDGRWLAYESDDSGATEIYVRPFPNVADGHWQVSSGGGNRPVWSRRGNELFYRAPRGALMRLDVVNEQTWRASTPEPVFPKDFTGASTYPGMAAFPGVNYDVSSDGRRFLLVRVASEAAESPRLVFVQNWFEELKRLAPTK